MQQGTLNNKTRIQKHMPVALAFVLLGLAGFGCQKAPTNTPNANSSSGNVSTITNFIGTANLNIPVTNTAQPSRSPEEREIQRLVSSFTERYGSYSNQTNFGNLESLIPFMTDALRRQTETFIKNEREKKRDASIYYGISTRAVTVFTEQYNDAQGFGVFVASTQRKESIGLASNIQTFQENLRVVMRKQGGGWKVDEALWQDRK